MIKKTEFKLFRSTQSKASISNSNILPSPNVGNLGVNLDECLTLDANINNICRRAHFHLRNIGRIRMLLSMEATTQLIRA